MQEIRIQVSCERALLDPYRPVQLFDFQSHLAYISPASLGALFFNHRLDEEHGHAKKLP